MSQQKYPKAYEAYQQAVYRDGRNPTFWCSIGVLYYQINQYRDALDAYSRAIRLNPYISEVWYDLGTLVSCWWEILFIETGLTVRGSMNLATTRSMTRLMLTSVPPNSTHQTSTSRLAFSFCAMVRLTVCPSRPVRRYHRTSTPRPTRLLAPLVLLDHNGATLHHRQVLRLVVHPGHQPTAGPADWRTSTLLLSPRTHTINVIASAGPHHPHHLLVSQVLDRSKCEPSIRTLLDQPHRAALLHVIILYLALTLVRLCHNQVHHQQHRVLLRSHSVS
jgi:tetratricopeptide (TPR) repeat protein